MCAYTLPHAITLRGCTDTLRDCTESRLWEKTPLPHWALKLASVLHLAFQSDTLPTEPSLPFLVEEGLAWHADS